MALPLQEAAIYGSPAGGDAKYDAGRSFRFAAFTNTSTATNIPLGIVPFSDQHGPGGGSVGGYILTGQPIQRLTGGQIALDTVLAASTGTSLGLAVFRTFGALTAQVAAADGARTTLPFTTNTRLPVGGTITLTNAAGNTDVWTVNADTPAGTTSITVVSKTAGATYAIGNVGVGIVGLSTANPSGLAFGWVTAGTGTPLLQGRNAISLPSLAGNLLVNAAGDLNLYPGDQVVLRGVDTGSVSVPIGIVQYQSI